MHAKITIEWDDGYRFVAENAQMEPDDLDLESEEVRHTNGFGEVVRSIRSIGLAMRAVLYPHESTGELYRLEQKPKEGA